VYIHVVANLQLIPAPSDTTGQREADSARARVLAEHDVTPEQLLAFAEVAGQDPGRSREIWEQIGSLVDSIRDADGLGPDSLGQGAEGALSRMPVRVGGDTLASSGVLSGEPTAGGTDSAEDSANAPPTAQPDSPQAVRNPGRGRPVAGQPVRRP
jgi:hypothetical protein